MDNVYFDTVLRPAFEDAKRFFLEDLRNIKIAHTAMLAEAGIISKSDAAALLKALRSIDLDEVRQFQYDGSCEDLFFYLERLVVERCGSELGLKMRVARSRNDVDIALY